MRNLELEVSKTVVREKVALKIFPEVAEQMQLMQQLDSQQRHGSSRPCSAFSLILCRNLSPRAISASYPFLLQLLHFP